MVKTIASIATRFTGKSRVEHISTINRYHRSRKEAAIDLFQISRPKSSCRLILSINVTLSTIKKLDSPI